MYIIQAPVCKIDGLIGACIMSTTPFVNLNQILILMSFLFSFYRNLSDFWTRG